MAMLRSVNATTGTNAISSRNRWLTQTRSTGLHGTLLPDFPQLYINRLGLEMPAAAYRGRGDFAEINLPFGVVQIHANEIHIPAETLRHPQHIDQMPWFGHASGNR